MPDNPLWKLAETGAQFTDLSRKQAEAAVRSLVKAGEVGRAEAEATVQRLLERGKEAMAWLTELVEAEVSKQLGRLAARVDDLEEQIESVVSRVGVPGLAAKKGPAKKAPAKKTAAKKTPVKKKAPAKKAPAAKKIATKAPSPPG